MFCKMSATINKEMKKNTKSTKDYHKKYLRGNGQSRAGRPHGLHSRRQFGTRRRFRQTTSRGTLTSLHLDVTSIVTGVTVKENLEAS